MTQVNLRYFSMGGVLKGEAEYMSKLDPEWVHEEVANMLSVGSLPKTKAESTKFIVAVDVEGQNTRIVTPDADVLSIPQKQEKLLGELKELITDDRTKELPAVVEFNEEGEGTIHSGMKLPEVSEDAPEKEKKDEKS